MSCPLQPEPIMEILPSEMVEAVAEYLTVRDLAACCATSRTWRDIFGADSVWKPRCTSDVAEYLRTTNSRVNPTFMFLENKDNTLSPIGEWRLSYFREQHLWNNWRYGKNLVEDLTVNDLSKTQLTHPHDNSLCEFINDDYLITSFEKEVMLWNVSRSPLYVSNPCHLLHSTDVDFCTTFFDSEIVIVQKTAVQIYHFGSPILSTWNLEVTFFFDRTETLPVTEAEKVVSTKPHFPTSFGCLVIENNFVGVLKSGEIHIWDLILKRKLKKVDSSRKVTKVVKIVKSEKPSKDFVVIVQKEGYYNFLVFSVDTLDFYPFNLRHELQQFPSCAIQNGLVAIALPDYFKVYKYDNSQLALIVPTEDAVGVLSLDSYFLFLAPNTIHTYNTTTGTFETSLLPLVDVFENINGFNDIQCNKFLTTDHYSGELVWEINLKSTHRKITLLSSFNVVYFFKCNRACTKKASKYWDKGVDIISFW